VREAQQKQRDLNRQADRAIPLLQHVAAARLLAEITNALPAEVSIAQLSLDTPQTDANGSQASVRIKLVAVANDASQDAAGDALVTALSQSPLLSDVKLDHTRCPGQW